MNGIRVYTYVSKDQLAKLTAYSGSLGLSTNAPLLSLLVQRALCGSLDVENIPIRESSKGSKVVINLPANASEQYLKLVERLQCSRSALASSLLVNELEERWLQASVQR